jgi:hypothetical protein
VAPRTRRFIDLLLEDVLRIACAMASMLGLARVSRPHPQRVI